VRRQDLEERPGPTRSSDGASALGTPREQSRGMRAIISTSGASLILKERARVGGMP
jgi:hypothetical protein